MKKQISFERAKEILHKFVDEMDGMDMERILANEFYVANVDYDSETDSLSFEPIPPHYNGELDG